MVKVGSDCHHAPGGESFQQAMGVIYNLVYTTKFRAKEVLKKDYDVLALEGLWWAKGRGFALTNPERWLWSLMIVVPDFVDERLFTESVEAVRHRKNPPGLEKARLETLDEGTAVQVMHIGPYSAEPASIAKMGAYAREHGFRLVGKHHEIYLGDPRRAAPSKLKTILRHPVARAA